MEVCEWRGRHETPEDQAEQCKFGQKSDFWRGCQWQGEGGTGEGWAGVTPLLTELFLAHLWPPACPKIVPKTPVYCSQPHIFTAKPSCTDRSSSSLAGTQSGSKLGEAGALPGAAQAGFGGRSGFLKRLSIPHSSRTPEGWCIAALSKRELP